MRPLTEAEIADLYEVRARLEAYGAELAAERADAADVAAIASAAEAFADAVPPARATGVDAVRALDAANARFHGALLAASRHGRIRQLVAGAVDAPLVFQALQRFERPRAGAVRPVPPAHRRRRRRAASATRAGRLMTEHVLQGRDALLQQLSDAGGVADLFAAGA